jgi:hypothetical protein
VDYYLTNNPYTHIEINPEQTESVDIKKERKIVPAHQQESPFQNEGDLPCGFESVVVHIPIKPHPQLDIIINSEPSSISYSFLAVI